MIPSSREREVSSDRSDCATNFVDDLVNLRLGHDQRRRQSKGLAGDADHDTFVLERTLHRLIGAQARRAGARGEVDTGGKAHGPDIEHAREAIADALTALGREDEARQIFQRGIVKAEAKGDAHAAGEMAGFLDALA